MCYLLWIAAAAAWLFIDAGSRRVNRWWAAVAVAGPIGLAAYWARRPLRENESREGGEAWQFLSMLVVFWTALLAFAAAWNVALPFVGMQTLAVAWACIAVPALVVGLALKRNTTEHGPTGMLRAMTLWFSGPERTADGRSYICRECGKEYSVDLPFCDGCGAWPGQSG
jgi:CDGSH-type Zn-finger protein